ncbi:MAG TPA: SDR family NAD(P)-dependent oxidoreductase [Bryobacteraceae bacterium]|jgi:dTDP-glucose 4,6-dehydratase|nr:SDR family NAD(P)-dependent oxidoreductase [Bryobacteraceae bacterium]
MPFWSGKRVLVTGAGGFIGSHLVDRLLEVGAAITAFVRYNSRNDAGFLELMGAKKKLVRIVYGDIRDLVAMRQVSQGMETIFHLAASIGIPYSYVHPDEVIAVNTIGTLNVLTAARECETRRVVVTSTSEVYGSAVYVPIDEKHPKQPQSPYSASKIAADAIALSYHLSFGLPVVIIRPFNTYGPRQSDRAIIPTIISQALTKKEIVLGNMNPTRDFTFVGDTVEGFLKAAESDSALGQEINLGTGEEISIGELAHKIAALTGCDVSIRQAEERIRPGKSEVRRLLSNNCRAKELLGWQPTNTLEQGLMATMEWVKDRLDMYEPEAYRI